MSRFLLPVALLVTSLFPARAMAQAVPSSACPDVDVLAPREDSVSQIQRARDSLTVPAARMSAARREPVDIAILASASASAVRFARQPEIRVRLCGGLDSIRVIERRNLPERIVPGQTYRDVYIAVEILGRVDAACLAQRLGVAPASDTTAASVREMSGDCAAVTVGGATSIPATAAPTTGTSRSATPGTEDAPARGQVTPERP